MTPPFIGLTGGIAAGKSEALAALRRLGAATLSSDEVVHELLGSAAMRDALVERWGSEVAPGRGEAAPDGDEMASSGDEVASSGDEVVPGGEIDRSRVAEIVFRDEGELRWLESQLHPLVGERITDWRASVPESALLAVVEVPLLFESQMERHFDAVLCVVASDETRARRAGRKGISELERRGGRQLSQQDKAARSDFVVSNDEGIAELEAKLAKLLPDLRAAGD